MTTLLPADQSAPDPTRRPPHSGGKRVETEKTPGGGGGRGKGGRGEGGGVRLLPGSSSPSKDRVFTECR